MEVTLFVWWFDKNLLLGCVLLYSLSYLAHSMTQFIKVRCSGVDAHTEIKRNEEKLIQIQEKMGKIKEDDNILRKYLLPTHPVVRACLCHCEVVGWSLH